MKLKNKIKLVATFSVAFLPMTSFVSIMNNDSQNLEESRNKLNNSVFQFFDLFSKPTEIFAKPYSTLSAYKGFLLGNTSRPANVVSIASPSVPSDSEEELLQAIIIDPFDASDNIAYLDSYIKKVDENLNVIESALNQLSITTSTLLFQEMESVPTYYLFHIMTNDGQLIENYIEIGSGETKIPKYVITSPISDDKNIKILANGDIISTNSITLKFPETTGNESLNINGKQVNSQSHTFELSNSGYDISENWDVGNAGQYNFRVKIANIEEISNGVNAISFVENTNTLDMYINKSTAQWLQKESKDHSIGQNVLDTIDISKDFYTENFTWFNIFSKENTFHRTLLEVTKNKWEGGAPIIKKIGIRLSYPSGSDGTENAYGKHLASLLEGLNLDYGLHFHLNVSGLHIITNMGEKGSKEKYWENVIYPQKMMKGEI